MLGAPPFSSTRPLHEVRPRLARFGLFNAGLALFVVALLFAAFALLVLAGALPEYVCAEDCDASRVQATRDLIAIRDAAAPYEDIALAGAILGMVATTADTFGSVLSKRPGSPGLRGFGILLASLATIFGFGHAAGFRLTTPRFEVDTALVEWRMVGGLHSEAIAGIWLFLVVGVLALVAFAASNQDSGVQTVGETSVH